MHFLLSVLAFACLLCLVGCGPFPMAVAPPLTEWYAICDAEVVREKAGLPTRESAWNKGTWNDYWCNLGHVSNVTPAQRGDIRRYLVQKRRAAGLAELSCPNP